MPKKRIMSGMRSTGKLHLGHYFGVLTNWKMLQEEYDCFYAIADWHALTTKYMNTEEMESNVLEVAKDWLCCGINPEISTIYIQSHIPEIAELHLLLSMTTPQNWVERDPTLKDMIKILRNDDSKDAESKNASYGLFGYPVLQTADIIIFNASLVPIGKDQLAHLELSRDIVRRFNYIYQCDHFVEPIPRLTEIPLLPGLDGQKMGKSFNNDIKISDSEDDTRAKIMKAITDPARIKKDDPGKVDDCMGIYPLFKALTGQEVLDIVKEECESAKRGCVQCKKQLIDIVNNHFKDIRSYRKDLDNDPEMLKQILSNGKDKARAIASETLLKTKKVMKINY
ncbi:MAG: tryptophan--tRNA ligase [Cyanobacteriota bacterium]